MPLNAVLTLEAFLLIFRQSFYHNLFSITILIFLLRLAYMPFVIDVIKHSSVVGMSVLIIRLK